MLLKPGNRNLLVKAEYLRFLFLNMFFFFNSHHSHGIICDFELFISSSSSVAMEATARIFTTSPLNPRLLLTKINLKPYSFSLESTNYLCFFPSRIAVLREPSISAALTRCSYTNLLKSPPIRSKRRRMK